MKNVHNCGCGLGGCGGHGVSVGVSVGSGIVDSGVVGVIGGVSGSVICVVCGVCWSVGCVVTGVVSVGVIDGVVGDVAGDVESDNIYWVPNCEVEHWPEAREIGTTGLRSAAWSNAPNSLPWHAVLWYCTHSVLWYALSPFTLNRGTIMCPEIQGFQQIILLDESENFTKAYHIQW